jgi:predicted Zn-dependent peptidase
MLSNVGMTRLAVAGCLVFCAGAPSAAAMDSNVLPQLGQRVAVSHIQGSAGTVIVEPAAGAPVAAVELWFRAPSIGFGAKPQPSLARVAAETVAASKPIVGPSLGEAISTVGGKLTINAYGDSIAVAALVPSDAARDIVKSMTVAFFSPVVTADGFAEAGRDVATEALVSGFDPASVVRDDVFAELFSGGPQHFSPLGTAKDVSAVTLESVRSFAQRAFRAQNAVLVVSGAVDPGVADAASKGRVQETAGGNASETPTPSAVAPSPEPITRSSDEAAAGYAWAGPPIANEDEATAMDFIADYLFRPDSGVVSRGIGELYPVAFVTGQFVTLRDPGVMFVAFGDGDLTALRGIVDRGIAAMRVPLDDVTFAQAREAFEYHLLSDLQTPTELADNYGWYSVEGNAEYAPGANGPGGAYFKAAAALTPGAVARVAQKYLARPGASVSLVPDQKKTVAPQGSAS